jgi:hypothetical protein
MLEQRFKGGMGLKKASTEDRPPPREPEPDAGGGGMMAELQNRLKKRSATGGAGVVPTIEKPTVPGARVVDSAPSTPVLKRASESKPPPKARTVVYCSFIVCGVFLNCFVGTLNDELCCWFKTHFRRYTSQSSSRRCSSGLEATCTGSFLPNLHLSPLLNFCSCQGCYCCT